MVSVHCSPAAVARPCAAPHCRARGAPAPTATPAHKWSLGCGGARSSWVVGSGHQDNALRVRAEDHRPCGGRRLAVQVFARRGGRAINYETSEDYVLLAPGADEEFVTRDELLERLEDVLSNWDGDLPEDLATYPTNMACAMHLVESACELELGGGRGSYQWFNVRLSQ